MPAAFLSSLPSDAEQVQSFFLSHGKNLTPNAVQVLLRFFGVEGLAGRLAALYAHPGRVTLRVLEDTGRKTTWGQEETREVLHEDGTVAQQEIDVTLQIGTVTIHGEQVEITARVRVKKIGAAGPSLNIGTFKRTFVKIEGKTCVEHELLELDSEYRGGGVQEGAQGLGLLLIANQIKAYPALGVQEVKVKGAWMGNYVWGRMGFQAVEFTKKRLTLLFRKLLTILQDSEKVLYKTAYEAYQVDELVAMHDLYSMPTQEVYQKKALVYDNKRGGHSWRQIWKEFVLNAFEIPEVNANLHSFIGTLKLQENEPNYEFAKRYLRIDEKGVKVHTLLPMARKSNKGRRSILLHRL
jgi:hypothetical protein